MAVSPGYQQFVVEQLERVGSITTRRIFGGVGLYADALYFAFIDEDRLYFKVDDGNRPDYAAVEMGPFRPYGDERTMPYYEVPVEVLEDPDALAVWAGKALDVARRAKRPKRRS